MSLELVVVRHGQTDWNVARRIQGSTDIPLNALGVLQAEHTRDALAAHTFDLVVSSQLSRAAVTADTINALHSAPRVVDERLAERSFAHVEGWTAEEVKREFGNFDTIEGVESWDAVAARMLASLEELAARQREGRILVVTHGSSIRALFGAVQSCGPRELPGTFNCSLSVLHHVNGSWSVASFNDNSHLPVDLQT